MAKDTYDKLKILSEVLKNNWPLILMCLTALGSGITNMNQYFVGQNYEAEKNKAIHDVTIGFQNAMIEIEPKEIIVKSTCSPCGSYLNQHLKEYH